MRTFRTLLRSVTVFAPVTNIVALISLSVCSANSSSSGLPLGGVLEHGAGHAAASAPRARHLATSRPFLRPPEATTGTLTAFFTSIKAAAVGIPQSQNSKPRSVLLCIFLSLARCASTAAQLVPPAPETLIAFTPAYSSLMATSLLMPAPTSLTITGTRELATQRFLIAARTPLNDGSPSGWTTS